MTTYTVHATRWEHGWELTIEGVGVTQSHGLKDAETMVRDYIALDYGAAAARDAEIRILPALDGLESDADAVRQMVREFTTMQERVSRESRRVARELRAKGLSGADTAAVLGVSPQRVSQLVHG